MQTIFEGFCDFFGRARKAKSPRDAGAFGGEREWKDSNLQPPVSGRGNGHAVPIFVSFFPLQGENEATSGAAGNRSPGQVGWRARRILASFSFRQSGANHHFDRWRRPRIPRSPGTAAGTDTDDQSTISPQLNRRRFRPPSPPRFRPFGRCPRYRTPTASVARGDRS